MGYHVHITREHHGEQPPIPLEDWLTFVRASRDLEFETPPGDDSASRFTRSIHAARWAGDEGAWLGWSDGEIWTKNPSEPLIRYMIAIAPTFQARVRGMRASFIAAWTMFTSRKTGGRCPGAGATSARERALVNAMAPGIGRTRFAP